MNIVYYNQINSRQVSIYCIVYDNARNLNCTSFCGPLIPIFCHVMQNVFRESLSVPYSRWKSLEVHCNNDPSIRHSSLKGENSKLSELSFNRLQLPDEECQELEKRSFGRFNAREAMLDEEYWVGFAYLHVYQVKDLHVFQRYLYFYTFVYSS